MNFSTQIGRRMATVLL